MKRFILLSAALMLGIMLSAQTQEGYVKTKGRMVDGQLVPGKGLKGATVCIKGKTAVLVKADNGAFSFPVTETQFRVDSVRKNGYQLVDMDALSKTYKPSANPIYLVMETPEQQLQDQLAAERRIRRTLTNQLHQKEDEIETLKEQQRISDEEYRQALQKLYEETDQNEQLVKDMVERYSTIDYDQLSEFDQRISELILNGELVKADSMLRTKGDINERVEQYRKHEAINTKEKEELTRRQASLKQSETAVQMERDDLANDCYRKFEIFKMQHLNDSAAYYIELRAGLDTTNIDWGIDAASFIEEYLAQYEKALDYYIKGLRNTKKTDMCTTALLYQNMGGVYRIIGEYNKVKDYYNKALSILESSTNNDILELVSLYSNMGVFYTYTHDFEQALLSLNKALTIHLTNYPQDSTDRILLYNNIGCIYDDIDEYEKALKYLNQARRLTHIKYGDESPNMALCYNSIGSVYIHQGQYEKALKYFEDALKTNMEFYGDKHPEIALCSNNLSSVYSAMHQFDKSINYSLKAVDIYNEILGKHNLYSGIIYKNIGVYYINLIDNYDSAYFYTNKALEISLYCLDENLEASCYNSLGVIYNHWNNFEEAKKTYEQALQKKVKLYGENSLAVADIYNNLSSVCSNLNDYEEGLKYALESMKIRKNKLDKTHKDVARSYNQAGSAYYGLNNYEDAMSCYSKALEIWNFNFEANRREIATVLSNIAYINLQMGNYIQAKEDYLESLEVYKSFVEEDNLSIGICYSGVGDALYQMENLEEALLYYNKSLEIRIPKQGDSHVRVIEIRSKISEIQAKLKEQENESHE